MQPEKAEAKAKDGGKCTQDKMEQSNQDRRQIRWQPAHQKLSEEKATARIRPGGPRAPKLEKQKGYTVEQTTSRPLQYGKRRRTQCGMRHNQRRASWPSQVHLRAKKASSRKQCKKSTIRIRHTQI